MPPYSGGDQLAQFLASDQKRAMTGNGSTEGLDVAISVGYLRGIIMEDNSKGAVKAWLSQKAEEKADAIKIVITGLIPDRDIQSKSQLTSAPLDNPKQLGTFSKFTAMFPLKGGAGPRSITIPGLIRPEHGGNTFEEASYKRETVDLLITAVSGNESLSLGKVSILITGEEIRTRQHDLPVDTTRDSVLRLQKKYTSTLKTSTSITAGKQGEIAPSTFRYDRKKRKYQIEKDALLRVFVKVFPRSPSARSKLAEKSNSSYSIGPRMGGPREFAPSHYGPGPSMNAMPMKVPNSIGGPVGRSSSRRLPPSPAGSRRGHPGSVASGQYRNSPFPHRPGPIGSRSRSLPRHRPFENNSQYGGSLASPGRTPPEYSSHSPQRGYSGSRPNSLPRQRPPGTGGDQGSMYGGSAYGFSNNGSRGPSPSPRKRTDHSMHGSIANRSMRRNGHENAYGGSSFHNPGPRSQSVPRPRVQNQHYQASY